MIYKGDLPLCHHLLNRDQRSMYRPLAVFLSAQDVYKRQLLYNKTLLDQNGITVKDNMTMDEFIALSREIEVKTGYKTNLCYNQNEQFLEYFLRADDIVL